MFDENDENENSKLFGFGLICLILGSSSIVLSFCWFMFEYQDKRQEILNRRTRSNYLNRTFFLNLNQSNQISHDNALYSAYLNRRRSSFRWYDRRLLLDAQQLPPSYHQAIATANQPSFINLSVNNSNNDLVNNERLVTDDRRINETNLTRYLCVNKDQIKSNQQIDNFIQLSVLDLQNLLPTYEEAINLKIEESNMSTKL